jgi:hypothetical protein
VRPGIEIKNLAEQPMWSKELVLWIGSENYLVESIGKIKNQTLDLLDLFDEGNLPMDEDETRLQLGEALRTELRRIPTSADNRLILIVKSIGLLARYRVGLHPFYDWFVGSFGMAVLLLDHTGEKTEWPDDVECDGNRLLHYFLEPGMVKDVYSTQG